MNLQVAISVPCPPSVAHEMIAALEGQGFRVLGDPINEPLVSSDEFSSVMRRAHGVVVGPTRITREMLAQARNLKVISKFGVGLDNIDLAAANEFDVTVLNTPGVNADSVADLVLGLILCWARDLPYYLSGHSARKTTWGTELSGRTIGIVGLGSIGRAVALRSTGFGLSVLSRSSTGSSEFADVHGIELVPFETLLSSSDIVTIHVPGATDSATLLGRDEIAMMRPGALLINTARSTVIDQDAVVRAIDDGQLGGAALDVYDTFAPGDHADRENDGHEALMLTPHIGGFTKSALDRTASRAVTNLVDELRVRMVRR